MNFINFYETHIKGKIFEKKEEESLNFSWDEQFKELYPSIHKFHIDMIDCKGISFRTFWKNNILLNMCNILENFVDLNILLRNLDIYSNLLFFLPKNDCLYRDMDCDWMDLISRKMISRGIYDPDLLLPKHVITPYTIYAWIRTMFPIITSTLKFNENMWNILLPSTLGKDILEDEEAEYLINLYSTRKMI